MKAAILWTGGKDSSLAFHRARLAGHEIVGLLTFVPEDADFLAHPVSFMKYQAEAIGIPHYEVIIKPPIEDAYEKAIRSFKERLKIDAVVTGDIAGVDGHPNWVRQRCARNNIEVLTPLWGFDRYRLFAELLSSGFKMIVSCIKKGSLPEEWLGRELDNSALESLRGISSRTALDICGEQGEYHTLVLDGPFFKKSVMIGSCSKHANKSVMYIKPREITLMTKP